MSQYNKEKGFNYIPRTKENGALAAYKSGETIKSVVRILDRIYYRENGFSIFRVEEKENIFIIKGVFPTKISLGNYYEIVGKVLIKDGEKQVEVSNYKTVYPSDREGVINILKSLHGLDMDANQLYDKCGPEVLNLIRESPIDVMSKAGALGYSQDKVLLWQQQLQSSEPMEEAVQALLACGLKSEKIKELLDEYGSEITKQLKENPYLLMDCMENISFRDCDQVALRNGIRFDNFERLRKAALFGLKRITIQAGHTYADEQDFLESVRRYAGYPLNYQQAQGILKQAKRLNRRTLKYAIGNNKVAVDTADLIEKIEAWKSEKKRVPFSYPLYQCSDIQFKRTTDILLTAGSIVCDDFDGRMRYRLSKYAVYEKKISDHIERIMTGTRETFDSEVVKKAILDIVNKQSEKTGKQFILEEKQMEAVESICSSGGGVFVLTGPAGSGKTFVLGIIIEVFQFLYQSRMRDFYPRILAPTGKAAKVAQRSTGLAASTIHRFVGYMSGIDGLVDEADLYVIDEASMVDEELLSTVLGLIPSHARLILVGDRNQLPSIGAGSCLRDIIESDCVPSINLNVVKRQENFSGILINANKILKGTAIETERVDRDGDKGNAYVVIKESAIQAREQILMVVKRAGLRRFHQDEIQVICPQKKGETGTYVMNLLIQKMVNPYRPEASEDRYPASDELKYRDSEGKTHTECLYFQVNDRVIHIKNDYKMEWYRKDPVEGFRLTGRQGIANGEIGRIAKILHPKSAEKTIQRIVVRYENEYLFYEGSKIKELMHAYAITIHRAQGSQWPIVLCPIMDSDYIMLNRQLLYTMYTRAQSTFFLTGSHRAIMRGIENDMPIRRKTMLREELMRKFGVEKR